MPLPLRAGVLQVPRTEPGALQSPFHLMGVVCGEGWGSWSLEETAGVPTYSLAVC